MASSMISTAVVAVCSAPEHGGSFHRTQVRFRLPTARKTADITTISNNGGRVSCMKVWPTEGGTEEVRDIVVLATTNKGATLEASRFPYPHWSHSLPRIRVGGKGTFNLIHFFILNGFPHRENNRSPGYYDGRYWTMWKLPMFRCTDPVQVLKELDEAATLDPKAFIRIIGFDNKRQVQIVSFIAHRPRATEHSMVHFEDMDFIS
ncbi:hypothetical protein SASPL_138678 [Salvia splendens]|uniref:Ribulose bisphosphate carboxylase small subunit domain-containing protein n=1 Tax=Salvia splendens TaxID=180675 RepID=A0A8X8WVM2_SALSN|nr:hypothetical protein SASPL_138678 [Salvia splendens]